ncbi:hypothetical protein ACT3UQ_17305 [Glutamicibacter sp. AOP12-B1-11]|uniref:hypothetical protein n=1 Tax=Glutamicibacter sp. AOP12-B1-11 TaxID=3457725 RepID=UPI004033E70E
MSIRRAVLRGLMLWLIFSLVGIGIVAVPDNGGAVFRLSQGHGPSPWDLLGIAMLLLGWVLFLVPLIRARALWPVPGLVLGGFLAGLAIVVWSVLSDTGSWWILGASLSAGVQLVAAIAVAAGRGPTLRGIRPQRE